MHCLHTAAARFFGLFSCKKATNWCSNLKSMCIQRKPHPVPVVEREFVHDTSIREYHLQCGAGSSVMAGLCI